jgi:hypothetical protein
MEKSEKSYGKIELNVKILLKEISKIRVEETKDRDGK